MNLTERSEIVLWPETTYAYIEKVGPFQKTAPEAWQEIRQLMPAISAQAEITARFSLIKVELETYRAGVALASMPEDLPIGLKAEKFKGGKYARFVLRGPWSDLPAAWGRVLEIVKETKLNRRDDFCIEHYVSDPNTTSPDRSITEILIPTV